MFSVMAGGYVKKETRSIKLLLSHSKLRSLEGGLREHFWINGLLS
jgi:hypothetical protein